MQVTHAAIAGYVLVVDDEEDIRDTLRELIEMKGFKAQTAANGAEALEQLIAERPCLVVLDLVMPVMDGVALLEKMRADPAPSDVPVVVSTSAPHLAPRDVPVVQKPIDIGKMVEWLHRY
ncbi:MAG: response regulator, partial [Polyangiaceae bacterium]